MAGPTESFIPRYLHLPAQVLWFTTHEVSVIIMCYLIAMTMGGFAWLLLIAGPAIIIPVLRKAPRGALQHYAYTLGLLPIKGYPLPTATIFHE